MTSMGLGGFHGGVKDGIDVSFEIDKLDKYIDPLLFIFLFYSVLGTIYGLVYKRSIRSSLNIILKMIFIDYLLIGFLMATVTW